MQTTAHGRGDRRRLREVATGEAAISVELGDLKPYKSLLLLEVAPDSDEGAVVDAVLDRLVDLLGGMERRTIQTRADAETSGQLEAGFLHFREERPAAWTTDDSVVDRINHVAVVCRRNLHVAIVTTDPGLKQSVRRRIERNEFMAGLHPIARARLNAAFVRGATRTLWLSGTHRRVTTKADAKILSGIDLRDSIDPLEDQTYYFSAARSVPTGFAAPIGTSPRKSSVWAGVSRSWEDFRDGVGAILAHLAGTADEVAEPFESLAVEAVDVAAVQGAFDVSLQPPELLVDEADPETRDRAEDWAYATYFEVVDPGPPIEVLVHHHGTEIGTMSLTPNLDDPERVAFEVIGAPASDDHAELMGEAVAHCRSRRWLKVRFDSGHTVSDGTVYLIRHRDVPFRGFDFVDFTDPDAAEPILAWDIDVEKPDPIGDVGQGQHSLFDWTFQFWPNLDGTEALPGGWLASDDGAMEIADFVHFDDQADPPVITLIHVKAAGSRSFTRQISVAHYEVVTGQAVKNLRHLDPVLLSEGLAAGLGKQISNLVWHDRVQSTRDDMIAAMASVGANYVRRVVVLQPHVRRDRIDHARAAAGTTDALRMRQLDTLLLSAEATCHGLGAEFRVVTSV